MPNLTITVDAETLKRARIRAIERGESVNRVLADQLRRSAETEDVPRARQRTSEGLTALAGRISQGSGGRPWMREELYDDNRTR